MDAGALVSAGAVGFAIAVCIGVTVLFALRQYNTRPVRVKARAAVGVRGADAPPGNMFEVGLAHLERLVERVERRTLSRLLVGDVVHELRQVLDEMRSLSDNDRLLDRVDTSKATDQFASSWFSLGMGATQYQQAAGGRASGRAPGTLADAAPGDDAVSALGRPPHPDSASLAALRLSNEAVELIGWIRGGFHEWDFDVARLRSWCASAAVPPLLAITLAMHADDAPGSLTRTLGCGQGALVGFVQRVVSEYRRLPYHSELHACDVLHAASVMHRRLCGSAATPHETGAIALAAMVHDLSHPGVNNAFLVETASPLAIRYNDASVLENHHISLAFSIMLGLERARPPATPGGGGAPVDAGGGNLLGGLERAAYKSVRSEMVQLVMATSFEHHFQHIGNLKAKAKPREARHAGGAPASADELKAAAEERLMLLKMIIKAADIGHPARVWAWHVDSAKRACAEFFYQGECEARSGLPVSPLNNAAECNLAKAQTGFLEFMVKPAFEVLRLYVEASPAATEPGALEWLQGPRDHLETNIANWKAMGDDESSALKAQILAIEIGEPFDPGWFAEGGSAVGGTGANTPLPEESQSRRMGRLSMSRGGPTASTRIGRIISSTLGLNSGSWQRSFQGSPIAAGSQSNFEREPSCLRSSSQADSLVSRADRSPSPALRPAGNSRAEATFTLAVPATPTARNAGDDDDLTSIVPAPGGPSSAP